jgi:hypothetical protein
MAAAQEAVEALRSLPLLPTPSTDDEIQALLAMPRFGWADLHAGDSGSHGLAALGKVIDAVLTAVAKGGKSTLILNPWDVTWRAAADDDGCRFLVTDVLTSPAGSPWRTLLPVEGIFDLHFKHSGGFCLCLDRASLVETARVNPFQAQPTLRVKLSELPDWIAASELISSTKRHRDSQRERDRQAASPEAQAQRDRDLEVQRRNKMHEAPWWLTRTQK